MQAQAQMQMKMQMKMKIKRNLVFGTRNFCKPTSNQSLRTSWPPKAKHEIRLPAKGLRTSWPLQKHVAPLGLSNFTMDVAINMSPLRGLWCFPEISTKVFLFYFQKI